MKFFIPCLKEGIDPENFLIGFCKECNLMLPPKKKRIYKLHSTHDKGSYTATVGESLDSYFQTGNEPVVMIINHLMETYIITENRGLLSGSYISANTLHSKFEFFD